MSSWPSSKANRIYRALLHISWSPTIANSGSHVQLRHPNCDYANTWAFHDSVEIGPVMLARIARRTGLKPEHL